MRYFTALVHQDGDSAYGLSFPDLPGCFAAAEDWNGISAAVTEALDLWFEDMPDVEPASLNVIRARADVRDAVAAGAVLMTVPYIPADTALERVNVSMERGLLRAIDETAKARKMTRSAFLASAARRELVGA
ncbi:type II toxin-antitoxin system HicB family antitoxin [Falsigemmobacter faecalis]|uniref:CopG family transcriptional regulator n=1 Tax=Falsigemmobacter faecalis TaxID=2488730 RepID=A0A3P3DAK8_9RHOB|nr:type II toxin-antitoxin system HicB family antitoxin [Falsigemmobacter faecalis]RRH71390.1 CopG family transcriptional regulator [Falsigemmobacter faecalis]